MLFRSSANSLPEYFKNYTYRNPEFRTRSVTIPDPTDPEGSRTIDRQGQYEFYTREWKANFGVSINWDIINPARVPQISAARDEFERARDAYLIALRDLRLNTSTSYFTLQAADERVRVGQASVRASLLSLRDARARYNAGVNTNASAGDPWASPNVLARVLRP